MDWTKLREDRCPRCASPLHRRGMLDSVRMCSDSHCLFKISIEKFETIVLNLRKSRMPVYDPDKNLSELNNLEL